jgi:acetoacetyl-CoA synthetase
MVPGCNNELSVALTHSLDLVHPCEVPGPALTRDAPSPGQSVEFGMDKRMLWQPDAQRIQRASITAFAQQVGLVGYENLHTWSLEQPEAFWRAVWDFTNMRGEIGPRTLELGTNMRESRFFPDATLNVTENLLARVGPEAAIIAIDEIGSRRELSWDELRDATFKLAGALKAVGVGPGDCVAAWLPLGAEAVIALLATSALGATFSSTSPDFGVEGVVDRFGQIEPKVLIAVNGYQYGGKRFDCLERLQEIQAQLPSLEQTVVIASQSELEQAELEQGKLNAITWNEFTTHEPITSLERFSFDQPWLVLYSSGTTGKPKCIVHRAGGVLLNLKKEHVLHCDIRSGDRSMYFTTTGWMMFNWLVTALASGSGLVLYDGNPFTPNPSRLLEIAEQERVTLLGVGAKYVDALRNTKHEPYTHKLERLRTVLSTGSPLSPESFAWIYSHLKSDVHLASISGGTDICGCFALGNPTEPVYAGELQRPGLGMAVDVWDEHGSSLRNHPSAPLRNHPSAPLRNHPSAPLRNHPVSRGELVCTQAFPSQPLCFWNDPNGSRYSSAYFEKFPQIQRGVWAHGDFASFTVHGGLVIHGRSDTTLNPGGVRIGTGEIYRAVENIPGVLESLVFAQDWHDDVRIVLLVKLEAGLELTPELRKTINAQIRSSCTPRHVPALTLQVRDLPRTRSNKLVELAVSDAVNGRTVRNTAAIANPEVLWEIAARPELLEGK